jgi:ferric-dicitrate binding protein FerR (iron transport regulator)
MFNGSRVIKTEAEVGVGIEQQALELMRRQRPQFEDEALSAARRERLLPDLTRYVEGGPRRRRQRLFTVYGSGLALAAAAAVALWVSPSLLKPGSDMVAQANGGEFWILRGEQQQTVRAGNATHLEELDQVRTPASNSATLTLPTGSDVQVNASSAVQIAQINAGNYETLRLLGGSVKVHVPKLKTGEYFAVLTETSKVVVHGTRFTVDVGAQAVPGATCVTVDEGLVAVHTAEQTHWVSAGNSFGCRPSETESQTPAATPAAIEQKQPQVALTTPPRSIGSNAVEQPEIATLAEQNRLFQRALTHQRREQWDSARDAYEELLRRFPKAPVASEARVQLRKIRDKIGAE